MLNHQPDYKAILFDLDDTLVDFKASQVLALDLVYDNFYKPHVEKEDFLSHFHAINHGLWTSVEKMEISITQVGLSRFQILVDKLSLSVDPQATANFYEDLVGSSITWLPGSKETLSLLKDKYKLGIVTNGFAHVQKAKHKTLSLDKWIEFFVISEEVTLSKPQKEIFDLALNEIGEMHSNTLMVGDSLSSDYQGSINAGIDFCWVNAKGDPLPDHFPEPKFTVSSVAELPAFLGV